MKTKNGFSEFFLFINVTASLVISLSLLTAVDALLSFLTFGTFEKIVRSNSGDVSFALVST